MSSKCLPHYEYPQRRNSTKTSASLFHTTTPRPTMAMTTASTPIPFALVVLPGQTLFVQGATLVFNASNPPVPVSLDAAPVANNLDTLADVALAPVFGAAVPVGVPPKKRLSGNRKKQTANVRTGPKPQQSQRSEEDLIREFGYPQRDGLRASTVLNEVRHKCPFKVGDLVWACYVPDAIHYTAHITSINYHDKTCRIAWTDKTRKDQSKGFGEVFRRKPKGVVCVGV